MVLGLLVVYARADAAPEHHRLWGVRGPGLPDGCGRRLLGRQAPAPLRAGPAHSRGDALVAISYVGLSFTRSAVLAVFVLGLQEVGSAVANVGSVTARQRIIPRNLYGRVSSVHRLMVAGSAPLGALLGGAIASWDGVPVAMFAAASWPWFRWLS